MERWKAHGWPCGLWPCCGTSIPMGLGYAVTPLPGDLHSMTSTASTITTTGFITCSSLPPWEGENYEPRNPVESGKLDSTLKINTGQGILGDPVDEVATPKGTK